MSHKKGRYLPVSTWTGLAHIMLRELETKHKLQLPGRSPRAALEIWLVKEGGKAAATSWMKNLSNQDAVLTSGRGPLQPLGSNRRASRQLHGLECREGHSHISKEPFPSSGPHTRASAVRGSRNRCVQLPRLLRVCQGGWKRMR